MRELPSSVLNLRRAIACGVAVAALWAAGAQPAWAQHPELDTDDRKPEACLGCHDDVKEAMGARPHKALDGGCLVCHDVTKATQSPFLRADATTVCAACHQLAPVPAATGRAAVPALEPTLAMPAEVMPRRKQLNLNPGGIGHPVAKHPVDGVSDPNTPDRPLTCVSCHRPHGSVEPKLLAFPSAGFCERCHKV